MAPKFAKFDAWADLLTHLRAGGPVHYHAPMDLTPRRVLVTKIFKNGKVRVFPLSTDADPFTADPGHLSRFQVMV